MLFTDLREVKTNLEIDQDDTREDVKLNFLNEVSSGWIEELLGRPGMTFKSRSEIYSGTGTPKLLLRHRPVYASPTIEVYQDSQAHFGASSGAFTAADAQLVWGTDFTLEVDNDDNTQSRCGILLRINGAWDRAFYRERGYLSSFSGPGRGNIKVVYSGGYTVDTLPSPFRLAANLLIQRLRYIMPLGAELNSDSFEDRNVGVVTSEKEKLLTLIKPLIWSYRNWKF